MLTLEEAIEQKMGVPAFKAEWDALEPEFQKALDNGPQRDYNKHRNR